MDHIPAPPNTNYIPICGYGYTNQKRDAACPYELESPVTSSSISVPQTSTSFPQTSTSFSQTSTSSVAPTKAASDPLASPYTNIQYANLTVLTGNLFGPAINEVITNGLKGICPPTPNGVNATCDNGKPVTKNVEFMIPGDGNYIIQEGQVSFAPPLSSYDSTESRDGMIAVIALFMENIAKEGEASCETNTSTWEDDDCTPEQKKEKKRDEGSGPGSEPGSKCERSVTMTYCSVPTIVQVEITQDNRVTEFMVSGIASLLASNRTIPFSF